MISAQSIRAALLFQLSIIACSVTSQPIRVAGTLDRSFNPNGYWVTSTGASVTGGYSGSIIIDLGEDDVGRSVATFDSNGERIIIGGYTDTGPGSPLAPNNFALVVLTETGALDRSFNPSGSWITDTGDSVPGGYAGSIIIDLGRNDFGQSVTTFDSNGERIFIGGRTTEGPPGSASNFALVVLTETGALDSSFNPDGNWITNTGVSIPGGGYPGSIIIDLGGFDYGNSVATFSSNGERIIIGAEVFGAGPGSDANFALVVLTETGALDSSFNPNGYWITSTGASITGGYPGSIIIDLGGDDYENSVATFQADGERIIIGGNANTGPGAPDNFALVVLTETGALDSSFNPSGSWITETGASIPGGYPGSIIIDLGGSDFGESVATFDSDGERIIIGGSSNTGPGAPMRNLALVVLTETGALDRFFNPSGLWITNTGASVLGGYPGSIIIDLGGNDFGNSVATFDSNGERIIIGGRSNNGPGIPNNFALAVLTETGALDNSFNPSGSWITSTGASITGGYAGSIIIDLGRDDDGESVATFQSVGERIIIGGRSNEGPGFPDNFALVVLNGETLFPPPTPFLSPLLALPFVPMAAA